MSPWAFDLILRDAAKAPLLRACDEYRPHPRATASPLSLEELAKQASRRMDTTHGLAAILRDAAKRPLLRMRSAAGAAACARAFAFLRSGRLTSPRADGRPPANPRYGRSGPSCR